jgi:hypothetical protein
MLKQPTEQPKDADLDLSNMLWTPDDDNAPVVPTKEEVDKVNFDKDAKKQGVHVSVQHKAISQVLQELTCIPKDVANVLTKTDSSDVIKACEFAEQRGYSAFVSLGRMVLDADNGDAMTHQLTTAMGDVWDRTDYTHLNGQDMAVVNQRLQEELQKAYNAVELIEDKWDDGRDEAARKNNEAAIRTWIDDYTLPLTKVARELHYLVHQKRELEEEKIERPKYTSLGEALKANDIPEFTRLLKKQGYDKTNRADLEVLNKLMTHAVKNGLAGAIEPLAATGADVNSLNDAGRTLFMQAIEAGRLDVAKELKNNGALVRQKDLNGVTELVIATKGGFVDAMEYLVEELKMDATDSDYGINASCWKGYTALVYAASAEQKGAVQYLLSQGADPTHEVWYEENATPDCYTEDPELEEILMNAQVAWANAHATAKAPKLESGRVGQKLAR